jgi:hypothetical protein
MASLLDLDEHKLAVLANMDQNEYFQILKTVIDMDLKGLQNEVATHPRFCDEDLTEDLRYKLGGIDRLQRVLRLPDEAKELMKKR